MTSARTSPDEPPEKKHKLIDLEKNLIISLNLVVDLWKRDNQNRNAQEIAERGAKLYDKFVGFVSNMEDIGLYIDKSKDAYITSYKQLITGNEVAYNIFRTFRP